MITFGVQQIVGPFGVAGDGTSTDISMLLSDPPFNFDLKGNFPVDVVPRTQGIAFGGTVTATLSTDRKSLLLSFSTPPPNDGQFHGVPQLTLMFAGQ